MSRKPNTHYKDTDGELVRIRPHMGLWRTRAACRGSNLNVFFPNQGEDCGAAKSVCANCPVTNECLEYALAAGEKYGVWGGVGEDGRRKLRKQRNAA